jgi:hypothetical protein
MNSHATRVHPVFWWLLLLALFAAAFTLLLTRTAAQSGREPKPEVLSFDMWCLEMAMYPEARCDAQRTEDVQDYEKYRADVEKFDAGNKARASRDQELQKQLNREPTAPQGTRVPAP